MNPILYRNIILLGVLIYPSGVVSLFKSYIGNNENTYIKNLLILFITHLVIIFSTLYLGRLSFDISFNMLALICIVLGVVLSISGELLLCKLFLGGTVKFFKAQGDIRKIFLLTALVAIVEELTFRGLLTQWLLYYKIHIVGVIIISSFIYAINHMFMGFYVVIMKFYSGIIFTLSFFISSSLLVPVLIHLFSNVIIIYLGKRSHR